MLPRKNVSLWAAGAWLFGIASLILGIPVALWARGDVPHNFELGPEISYIKYEEPDVMEEKGMLYGVYANYTFRDPETFKIKSLDDILQNIATNTAVSFEGKFAYGQLDYTSEGSGSLDDIDDYLIELRTKLGYDFGFGEASRITPFFGFGFRYLNDDTGGKTTTTGARGYERESYYYYLPFGVESKFPFGGSTWSWGLNLEYDLFLSGTQKSHLEDVVSSLGTLENDQNDGYGVRGSVRFVKENVKWDLILEPYARYWDIDDSDTEVIACDATTCLVGFEPKNDSLEAGLRVGARF